MSLRPIAAALAALSVVTSALPSKAQNPDKGLTLPQAVELALKNNPSIKAASDYGDAVRRGIAVAEARRYPRLDFSEDFTRGNNPVYVFGSLLTQRQFTAQNFQFGFLNTPTPVDNFRTQLAASVPLFDAGQARRQVRDARLDTQSAERALDRTRQETIFNVITAYTNELLAQESVRVAEASLKSTREDLARAQARQEEGQALLSDVLLAKAQFAQAQADLIRARNDEAVEQASLNVAMGLAEDAPVAIQGSLNEIEFQSGALSDYQRRALKARPDYQQALIGKEKARNGIGAARAEWLPQVNAFSSWEVDNQTFASRGGNNWIAGATLNFNVFNGGARSAEAAQARAREHQAEALESQMASAIRLQVREAFLNLNSARERVEVSRQSASQIAESLRILRDRYEAGLATITDVLTSEAAHARAQRDYLNAVYDCRIAFATLELATGELSPDSQSVVR